MTHGYKPPLCDCPTDASLARLDALVIHLDLLCMARFFLPNRRLNAMLTRAADRQYDAYCRRYGCRWHNEDLRELYFRGRFPDETPTP